MFPLFLIGNLYFASQSFGCVLELFDHTRVHDSKTQARGFEAINCVSQWPSKSAHQRPITTTSQILLLRREALHRKKVPEGDHRWSFHIGDTDICEHNLTSSRLLMMNFGSYGLIISVLTGGVTRLTKVIEYHGVAYFQPSMMSLGCTSCSLMLGNNSFRFLLLSSRLQSTMLCHYTRSTAISRPGSQVKRRR